MHIVVDTRRMSGVSRNPPDHTTAKPAHTRHSCSAEHDHDSEDDLTQVPRRASSPFVSVRPVFDVKTRGSGDGYPEAIPVAIDHQSPSGSQTTPETCFPVRNVDWLRYATQIRNNSGGIEWKCLWKVVEEDSHICYYWGKKQLVKRHIENVHLKIK